MGKKTDKFTAALIQIGGTCQSLLQQLIDAAAKIDANGVEWDKHAWPYSDYYSQLMQRGLKNDEEMLKVDPGFKPYYDAYMKVQTDRDAIWDEGRTSAGKLQEKFNELQNTLGEFKKYIDKKAKSKNPFKSKKSLPAAQDTIKQYQASIKLMDTALGTLKSKFR